MKKEKKLKCPSVRPLILMSSQDLSLSQHEQLEEHLTGCPDCAQRWSDYEALRTRVRSAAAQEPLPDLTKQWAHVKRTIEQTASEAASRSWAVKRRKVSLAFRTLAPSWQNSPLRAVSRLLKMPFLIVKDPLGAYLVVSVTMITIMLFLALVLAPQVVSQKPVFTLDGEYAGTISGITSNSRSNVSLAIKHVKGETKGDTFSGTLIIENLGPVSINGSVSRDSTGEPVAVQFSAKLWLQQDKTTHTFTFYGGRMGEQTFQGSYTDNQSTHGDWSVTKQTVPSS